MNIKKVVLSKGFLSGAFFVVFGLICLVVNQNYPLGTAREMGPGYFPMLLAILLLAVGAISILRAFIAPEDGTGKITVWKMLIIIGATVLFGICLRPLGIVISILVLVFLSAMASIRFKLSTGIILAAALSIGSTIVFVLLLRLPIPLFGTIFGG